MDTLYLVMPAYNEEETIREVLLSWYPMLSYGSEASRLLVDISGSTDKTAAILEELQTSLPKLRVFDGGAKEHGPKLLRLYHIAIRAGADYIFQTDSDGQTNPGEFPAFFSSRSPETVLLGCRRVRGDGPVRKFVEEVLCAILLVIFQVRIPDANAPFRLMPTAIVKKYIGRMQPCYNLPNVMLSVYFCYFKEDVRFEEISFGQRAGGTNSINLKKIVRIGIAALRDFLSFRRTM